MKKREIIKNQNIEIARLSDVIVGLNARLKTQAESIVEYQKENKDLRRGLQIEEVNNTMLKRHYESKLHQEATPGLFIEIKIEFK